MQCPNCGKTGFVTISNKRYCSNCGAQVSGGSTPAVSDIRRTHAPASAAPSPVTTVATPLTAPKPATRLHGAQIGTGVLDLRPRQTAAGPPAISPARIETPKPKPVSPPAPVTTEAMGSPAPIVPPAPTLGADKAAARLEKAAQIPKSELVQKFVAPAAVTEAQTATESPLPNAVATQVDAMQQLAKSALSAPAPGSATLKEVISSAKPSRFNPASVAAASAAILIMGGYIWAQNYPKMAFHMAASKAGLEASLPGYIPASYHQSGPVSYQPGQITLNFTSPGANETMRITQRKTDWDSNSLRENFVAQQTDNYLAVQGQGLTIYMYNDDQASWVNHGVWYQITGASKLGREQVLKIAYSL